MLSILHGVSLEYPITSADGAVKVASEAGGLRFAREISDLNSEILATRPTHPNPNNPGQYY